MEIKDIRIAELKFLPFNREVGDTHVKRIQKSIGKFGLLRCPVIVRTKQIDGKLGNYILDGQHLIHAQMRMNKKVIPCILFASEKVNEIVELMSTLNNVVSTWGLSDYVNAYSSIRGHEDYVILRNHKMSNGFTYEVSSTILGSRQSIKTGDFKVLNSDSSDLTKYLKDVSAVVGGGNSKFQMAFIRFYRQSKSFEYHHNEFLQVLRKKDPICFKQNSIVEIFNILNQLHGI